MCPPAYSPRGPKPGQILHSCKLQCQPARRSHGSVGPGSLVAPVSPPHPPEPEGGHPVHLSWVRCEEGEDGRRGSSECKVKIQSEQMEAVMHA